MADLGNLTNKVMNKVGSTAKTVGKTVGGVTSSLAQGAYSGLQTGITRSLDLNSLRPTNIVGGALDSVGLGALIPALKGAGDSKKNDASKAADRVVAAQNKSTISMIKPLEELLQKLVTINEKILENSNSLLTYSKKQSGLLDTSNELVKKQMLQDIENAREAIKLKSANDNKVSAAPANDNKKSGGFLDGIMNSVKGLLGSLGPIGSFITSIGSVLARLASFALRFMGPLAILAGIFLALERQDWAMMFDNLGKVFGDLANGKILDALVRMIGTIGDVLLKGLGRILTGILSFFGFKETAKMIDDWLDNFNLADKLVEWLHAATDWLADFGKHLKEGAAFLGKKATEAWDFVVDSLSSIWDGIKGIGTTIANYAKAIGTAFINAWNFVENGISSIFDGMEYIGNWISKKFNDALKTFSDWWNSFSVIDPILNTFNSIKDWIVEKFTNTTKAFSDWWNSFSVIDPILNTFNSIKDWIVEKFTNATNAFSEWWGSFSIIEIVLTPFNYIKDTATALFDNLYKAVSEVLSFDLVGKISSSIGSVINGVWDFFKGLPSKAVDLISGFLPDSLKGFFKSIFGSNTPAQEVPKEQNRPTLTPQNLGKVIQERENNINPTQTNNNVVPVQVGREQVFNQQSARMSLEQAAPPPVIINNSTNSSFGAAAQNSPPRTSGAVQTAPQSSHIDRALYGDHYGAGVP